MEALIMAGCSWMSQGAVGDALDGELGNELIEAGGNAMQANAIHGDVGIVEIHAEGSNS